MGAWRRCPRGNRKSITIEEARLGKLIAIVAVIDALFALSAAASAAAARSSGTIDTHYVRHPPPAYPPIAGM